MSIAGEQRISEASFAIQFRFNFCRESTRHDLSIFVRAIVFILKFARLFFFISTFEYFNLPFLSYFFFLPFLLSNFPAARFASCLQAGSVYFSRTKGWRNRNKLIASIGERVAAASRGLHANEAARLSPLCYSILITNVLKDSPETL